jgi:hypothetical protein
MISHGHRHISGYLYCFLLSMIGISPLIIDLHPAWGQQIFKTQRTEIHYLDPTHLHELEHQLSFSQTKNFHQQYLFSPDPVQSALSPGLAIKIDGLLAKVSHTLNLQPNKPNRLRIVLLANGKEVRQRWLALQPVLRDRPIFGYGALSGFYESFSRTIFLSLADLQTGVLAHEMAHFILNESFSRPPSAPLQEQWAQYVEANLD